MFLLRSLSSKINDFYAKKASLVTKNVIELLNKLLEESKTDLMPPIGNIINQIYILLGEELFYHLKHAKAREVMEKYSWFLIINKSFLYVHYRKVI